MTSFNPYQIKVFIGVGLKLTQMGAPPPGPEAGQAAKKDTACRVPTDGQVVVRFIPRYLIASVPAENPRRRDRGRGHPR